MPYRACFLLLCGALSASAQPAVNAVVSSVSFQKQLCPGAPAAVFGVKLAAATALAASLPLPLELGGTAVEIGGVRAPLYYTSAAQVNFQVPFELAPGATAARVITAEGASSPFPVTLDAVAPAVFSRGGDGLSPPLLLSSDFHVLDTVQPGQNVILYAAGLGQTVPAWTSGAGGGSNPVQKTALPVILGVGLTGAPVLFAGAAPGFAGVYQVNTAIPPHPWTNTLALAVVQGNTSVVAPPLKVSIRNPEIRQASGSISFVFPQDGYTAYALPVPVVARYTADVETVEGAGDYLLSLSCSSGGSRIMVSPAQGRYTVSMYVPTAAARMGNFSAGDIPARDLLMPGAPPFPGGIVPANRLDPAALQALNLAPLPNGAPAAGYSTALYEGSGMFAAGTHFHVDSTLSPDPTVTPGYYFIAAGDAPGTGGSYGCSLYLDGMLLDQKKVQMRWP